MVMATINQAMYSALNVSTLTDVVGTGKIFSTLAPEGTARPYIIFSLAGGGLLNESPRESFDVTVTVKCVSKTAAQAQTVADLIEGLLHETTITATGWHDVRVQQSNMFMYQETIDSQQIWHAGANYRLRSAKLTI